MIRSLECREAGLDSSHHVTSAFIKSLSRQDPDSLETPEFETFSRLLHERVPIDEEERRSVQDFQKGCCHISLSRPCGSEDDSSTPVNGLLNGLYLIISECNPINRI